MAEINTEVKRDYTKQRKRGLVTVYLLISTEQLFSLVYLLQTYFLDPDWLP